MLEFVDRRKVDSIAAWPERREEIRALMVEHFIGSYPEQTPAILSAEVTASKTHEDGSVRGRIRVVLDTPRRVAFEMALWAPSGAGPFPLLLTCLLYTSPSPRD